MARHWGMALAPWDAMGGGHFQTKAQMEERKKNNEGVRSIMVQGQTEQEVKVSEALEKVAKSHGVESITAIALAYVMAKTPNVFPLVSTACVKSSVSPKLISCRLGDAKSSTCFRISRL